ncbi:hypothetical protein D9M71_544260 [compost metagenome]
MDAGAKRPCALGNPRRRESGLRLAVIDGVDAAQPLPPSRRDLGGGLRGAQHPRIDVELARRFLPSVPFGELLGIVSGVLEAATAKAEIDTGLRGEFVP